MSSDASLVTLCENKRTDKNTEHSYAPVYDEYFRDRRYTARNILELGVQHGGSILLWHEYFENADIYGADIKLLPETKEMESMERIHLVCCDAYNTNSMEQFKQRKYDVIIDDGPHTLESMQFMVKHYLPLLTEDGILIVEDIQYESWLPILKAEFPVEFQPYVKVVDLRPQKGRYDDILLVLDMKDMRRPPN